MNCSNGGGGGIEIVAVSTGGGGGIEIVAVATGGGIKIAAVTTGAVLVVEDVEVVVEAVAMTAVDVVVVVFCCGGWFMVMFISCWLGNSNISLWFTVNVFIMLAILISSAVTDVNLSCSFCCSFLS